MNAFRLNTVIAALSLLVVTAENASAIQVGLGAGLPGATNLDSGGSRINIEGQSTALGAGTYRVDSFEYLSSANGGNVQPFLATGTGPDSYTVIWVGPTDAAPGVAGTNTEVYSTEFFNLATGANVFAGINTSSNIVFFADPDGPSVTDHGNPALFAIVPGSNISGLSNNNLSRNYAFAVNVTQVIPEPATGLLGLLGVAGLAVRRRRVA